MNLSWTVSEVVPRSSVSLVPINGREHAVVDGVPAPHSQFSTVEIKEVEDSLHKCVSLYMADIHRLSVLEDEKAFLTISGTSTLCSVFTFHCVFVGCCIK